MKISLVENGLDSLKKGFDHLIKYEEMSFLEKKGKERYFVLKDAILAIHHGIEILLKQTLINTNELLVFTAMDQNLKNAFREKRQKNLDSIFETAQSAHTVTLQEALDRIRKVCGYHISNRFNDKLTKLDIYRNQITHSAVFLKEAEINNVFNGLVDEIDSFFLEALGSEYPTLTGYSDFKRNYEKYVSQLNKTMRGAKKEVIQKLIEAFSECSISMGENEVKIVNDIDVVTKLLAVLTRSSLTFGTDFYNGHCSGNVSRIKRISQDHISLFTADNNAEYRFKFKDLLLYLPSINDDLSPILFFEAAEDKVDARRQKHTKKDIYGRCTISGLYFPEENRYEWDPKASDELSYRSEYDEYFIAPECWFVEDFLSEGVLCFLNVQGLNFGNLAPFLSGKRSLKEMEVGFRKSLKKKK